MTPHEITTNFILILRSFNHLAAIHKTRLIDYNGNSSIKFDVSTMKTDISLLY